MTDRTGQSAIQAVSAGGLRELSPSSGGVPPKKFNPGWGVRGDYTYVLGESLNSFDTNKLNEFNSDVPNVKHYSINIFWGAIETAEDVYDFDLIDAAVAYAQSKGIRLTIIVLWAVISSGSTAFQVSQGRFPAYLNNTGLLFGPANGRCDVRLHTQAGMDRWLALNQALADRYDTHPWIEGIGAVDSTPSALIAGDTTFSQTEWQVQFIRQMVELNTMWLRTNVFLAMDSGFGSSATQKQAIVQAAADNRMVFTSNDIYVADMVDYGGTGGRIMQRIYLGIDGTKDFRSTLAFNGRTAQNNFGTFANPPPTTYATNLIFTVPNGAWYRNIHTNFQARWSFLPYKTNGYTDGGTANDNFWSTAASGYTLNAPTIKQFLQNSAGSIALTTTKPPNYATVITGGT